MQKMKNRLLSLALALVLCLSLTVPALAAEAAVVEAIPCERNLGTADPPAFHEGLACAWDESKCGFIDKTDKVVIPYAYDAVGDFSEGLASVKLDGKWGFIDKTGKEVIPCKYDSAGYFSEGLAEVKQDGKWGYIDRTGNLVIPCKYNDAWGFSEGLATVEKNGKWGYIDKAGEEVISCKYDTAKGFRDGLAVVVINKKYGFIDQTGEVVISFQYDNADSFFEGLAFVKKNSKYGYVDKTGKEVIPCKYDGAGYFSEGLAGVKQDGKWGYIDRTGNLVIPCKYNDAWGFSEGFAPVARKINDLTAWGYIDKSGNEVVPCKADSADAPDRYVFAYTISEGMAAVVRLEKSPGGPGYTRHYGYLAFSGGKEEPANNPSEPEETPVDASDVQVSNWAKEQVSRAAASGLTVDGLGNDYRVNITRAQFAAVSVKLYEAMSGQTAPAAGDSPFSDTSAPAVVQAAELGFVGGVGDGKFNPDALVTREQAAVMLSRVYTKLGGEIPKVDKTSFADDASVGSYAKDAVAFMSSQEIVSGTGNNQFSPKGNASIEQALVIALRMFEKLK